MAYILLTGIIGENRRKEGDTMTYEEFIDQYKKQAHEELGYELEHIPGIIVQVYSDGKVTVE